MADRITATQDASFTARVTGSANLSYTSDPLPDVSQRLANGRYASEIVQFVNRLALVQDDAHCLILVDLSTHQAWSQSIAPDSDVDTANLEDAPLDLEACATIPGTNGQKLIAFASGAQQSQEWVVTLDWRTPANPPRVVMHEIPEFFQAFRDLDGGFTGDALNVEGAMFVDDDTMRFFIQRPLADAPTERDGDATVDVPWELLELYLRDPTRMPAPEPSNLTHYDFGTMDGDPLLFSDACLLRDGRLLYAATVQGDDPQTTPAVFGIIDDGSVQCAPLKAEDGSPFDGKIEGLMLHPDADDRVHFVIDAARTGDASRVYEAEFTLS